LFYQQKQYTGNETMTSHREEDDGLKSYDIELAFYRSNERKEMNVRWSVVIEKAMKRHSLPST
jgi:hypothetical protein